MHYILTLILVSVFLATPGNATEDTPSPADVSASVAKQESAVTGVTPSGESAPSVAAKPAASDEAGAVTHLEGDVSGDVAPQTRHRTALPPDPNRRWIMKQPQYEDQKSDWKPQHPVEWQGASQELRCRQYEKDLIREYKNARYYSIQGDRCKTAQYSEAFLGIVDKCQTGCPDAFLESVGFDGLFIRNMRQLKALGTEYCLGTPGPSSGRSSESSAASTK